MKKTISITIAALLFVIAFSSAALAREEVVYVNLGLDGVPQQVYVVSTFPDQGPMMAFGNFSHARPLIGATDVVLRDDGVSFNANRLNASLETALNDTNIPWEFTFEYAVNGQPVQPENLAGSNGRLQIDFSVMPNEALRSFFDHYRLEIIISLNTVRAVNIDAIGATIVHDGVYRRLTYTLTAGRESNFTIFADVTDFQMPAIEIRGMVPNAEALFGDGGLGRLAEELHFLRGAISELYEAMEVMNYDFNILYEASMGLILEDFTEQVYAIINNANIMTTGNTMLGTGLHALNNQRSALMSAQWQGFSRHGDGVRTSGVQYMVQHQINTWLIHNGLTPISLSADPVVIQSQLGDVMLRLNAAGASGEFNYLIPVYVDTLLAVRTFYDMLRDYTGEVYSMIELGDELSLNAGHFQTVFTPFMESITTAFSGMEVIRHETLQVHNSFVAVSSRFALLYYDTSNLLEELIESIADETGHIINMEWEPISFMSIQNSDIESVQFVIRTNAVEMNRPSHELHQPRPRRSFFQRLLGLFS